MTGLQNCLKRGVGLTIFPKILVEEELKAGHLVGLPWEQDPTETSVLMIWHVERWCSPLLKEFMTVSEEVICRGSK